MQKPPILMIGGFLLDPQTAIYRVLTPFRPEERRRALANSVAATSLARCVVAVSCDLIAKQVGLVQFLCRY